MKNHGHDVLARSARPPVLSAMSALNASAQRGQDDMRGFAGRARIETHHPAKHSALESLAATRWPTAQATGFQASCTGGAPVQRAWKPCKVERVPHVPQGTVKPACRGPAGVCLEPGFGMVEPGER